MTTSDRIPAPVARRPWLRLVVIALFAVSALFAIAAGLRYWINKPTYATRSIPLSVWSGPQKETGIWWLDNDRVIFSGGDPEVVTQVADVERPLERQAIFIWNTKTNEYRRQVELDVLGRMTCFEDGRARYYTSTAYDKTTKLRQLKGYEWRFGTEAIERNPNPESDGTNRGLWLIGRFGCLEEWETNLVRPTHGLRHRIIWPLWKQDGYIYAPTDGRDPHYPTMMSDPVQWWRPGSETPVTLPLMIKQLRGTSVYFSEYKRLYVIAAGVRAEEKDAAEAGYSLGNKRPVYYINRSGVTDVTWFPAEDWIATGQGFLPTVAGILVVSRFTRRASSYDMGAWIITGRDSHKIINHIVEDFSVSPDGCKAVVAVHNPDKSPRYARSMTTFDFCHRSANR